MKKKLVYMIVGTVALSMFTGCSSNKTTKDDNVVKITEKETTTEELTTIPETTTAEEISEDDSIWGSWVTSGESEFVFEPGQYAWYKSSEDHEDNYYKGNIKILKGYDAAESLGITMDKVMDVIIASEGKVTYDNIYAIECQPTYLISGGIDKTNTLTSEFNQKLLFIVIQQKEAQGYNFVTGDTYYLTKQKNK